MPTLVTQYSLEEFRTLVMQCVKEAMQEVIAERKAATKNGFMTMAETCEYLNLSRHTVYKFTADHTIPFIKRGKKLYFRKDDLDGWLMSGFKKEVHKSIKRKKL